MKCERCNDREALPFAPACASCFVDKCGPTALCVAARLSAFEEAARACRGTRNAYAASPVWDAAINACAAAINALAAKERTP